ncbi:MAG: group II truncated hemoglobin [Bdellovibrionales bacterium]|nr:group II truncated hemoglobin [Bdellovibrionales bacterium]
MNATLYEQLGGEPAIRNLVDRFYGYMDTLPEAAPIRQLHPADLQESITKLSEFLVGWSGGPPLYVQKYGHPRLRMRHLPFPIGPDERDQWMFCMRKALAELDLSEALLKKIDEQFYNIADFMQNKLQE